MGKPLIPLRPSGLVSSLTQPEQSALTWYVISGCTKKDAFITFARPDMLDTKAKAALDDYVKQFFARKEVKEYIEAYEKTLSDAIDKKPLPSEPKGTIEERKARAKTKLVEFAMSLANNITEAADPEFVLKVADKAGLLDMNDEAIELPRRYLPVTCGSCEYRKFVEENCDKVDDGTVFEEG